MCVGHLGQLIDDVIRTRPVEGLDIQVRFDGPHLLGTAGALRAAAPALGNAFFVLYGDSYLTCDFRQVQAAFEASHKLGLMTVFRNEGRWDTSNIEFQAGRIVAYDKRAPTRQMRHIDYGLGVLKSAALASVPEGKAYDLALLYQDLLGRSQLGGYEVGERFYEIGSLEGLQETRMFLGSSGAQLVEVHGDLQR